MDPLSALGLAGTIIAVTDTGVRVSIGLLGLAESVKTAAKSIRLIGNDVSATCGILAQLRDLAQPKQDAAGAEFCIFNAEGLQTLRSSTDHCSTVFADLQAELQSASKQVAGRTSVHAKIELSIAERAKWPFLQPKIRELRTELGHVKGNLVVILSIAHLAHAEKISLMKKTSPLSAAEKQSLRETVLRLRQPAASSRERSREPVAGKVSESSGSESGNEEDPEQRDDGTAVAPALQVIDPVKMDIQATGAAKVENGVSPDKVPSRIANPIGLDKGLDVQVISFYESVKSNELTDPTINSIRQAHLPQNETKGKSLDPKKSATSILERIRVSWRSRPSKGLDSSQEKRISLTRVSVPQESPLDWLMAWTLTTVPTLSDGLTCTIEPLRIPQTQIQAHLRDQQRQTQSVLKQMERLNSYQRTKILAHAGKSPGELVSVGELCRQQISCIVGDIEVAVLLWIKQMPSIEKHYADTDLELRANSSAPSVVDDNPSWVPPPPPPRSPFPGTNTALADYQLQLMLNEQQNKKRLLMARQEQDSNTSGLTAPLASSRLPNLSPPARMAPGFSQFGGPTSITTPADIMRRRRAREERSKAETSNTVNLTIKILSGKGILLFVNSAQTILSIKQLLQRRFGYVPEAQTLLLDGKPLADDQNLRYHNVGETATIHLVMRIGKTSQIHVKTYDDNHLVLNAELDGPVDSLMRLVATMTGVTASEHYLIFRGKPLDDGDCTVAFYGVQANDMLVLARKPQHDKDGSPLVGSSKGAEEPSRRSFGAAPISSDWVPGGLSFGPAPLGSTSTAPHVPSRLPNISETSPDSDDDSDDGLFQKPVRACRRTSDSGERPTLALKGPGPVASRAPAHAQLHFATQISPPSSAASQESGDSERVELESKESHEILDGDFDFVCTVYGGKQPDKPRDRSSERTDNRPPEKIHWSTKKEAWASSDVTGAGVWDAPDSSTVRRAGNENKSVDDSTSADSYVTEVRRDQVPADNSLVDDLIAKWTTARDK